MAAHLTIQDIRQFPPDVQRQIMAELYPEPIPSPTHPAIPPAKPAEWWQIDGQPVKPVIGEPIVPHKPAAAKEWYNTPKARPIAKTMKKRKSRMIWYILLAYVLLIALCIIPGLIYQIR